MTQPEWDRIQDLFLRASDLAAEERAGFLSAHCGGDAVIRGEVEALLAADETAGDRLRRIVASAAIEMQIDEASNAVGQRVGAYVIDRAVGSGGMGTVYLAFRDDDQFRQRVAIKVINRGTDSEFALTRFRRERQVLADLQHPNIARLLDGGATGDGRPFFAMEFLEGAPLTAYCERMKLGKRARLHLFLQICAAVQYAHRNLVIHGDLKPGNILVGEDGAPKLLDFGIATLIDVHSEPAECASPVTRRYASPEQIGGKALTTATDIYSLGAVLRELLGAQASGDLEHIVRLAMRERPDERYASVEELARDIQRYIEFRPVKAHQGSAWRRAVKFARRRWLPLLAGFAVLASLVGGMAMAWMKAREAEAARAVAEDRLTQMVGLSDQSLSDVSLLMERLSGAMPARRELIGSTLDFLGKLSKNASTDGRLSIALAKGYSRLGTLQGGPSTANLGDWEGALKSWRTGVRLLESPSIGPSMQDEARKVWVELQGQTGMVLTDRVDPAAGALLLDALEKTSKWPAPLLADKGVARSRAGLYRGMARALHNDAPRARGYAEQYLNAMTALANQYPADADLRYDLSVSHTELGFILWNTGAGDPEAAEPHYRESIRIRERLVNEYPADMIYRRSLILAYRHLATLEGGSAVVNLGNTRAAQAYYRKALALAETVTADPQDVEWVSERASLLLRGATLDPPAGGPAESLATLRHVAAEMERLATRPGQGLRYNISLGTAYEYMGRRLAAMGKYAEAMAEYRRAVQFAAGTLAVRPLDAAALQLSVDTELEMARVLTLAGDRVGALQHAGDLLSRVEHYSPALPLRETWTGQAYLSLAGLHRGFHECAEARDAAKEAIRHTRPLLTGRSWDPNAVTVREAQTVLKECSQGLHP